MQIGEKVLGHLHRNSTLIFDGLRRFGCTSGGRDPMLKKRMVIRGADGFIHVLADCPSPGK
jgi:hypothetical protein